MSIDNVTIHQGYELPNGTNTLAHDVVRLINALTSIDSDVFLRPLASSSTYVGTTAIALNRASAAQALTGITSIDGSAATLTTSRTLWGQSFNGSANVTGNLTSVGNITGSGAISLTTAAASNLSLTSGTTGVVFLDSGTTGAINIGTGANTKTITIGSSTGTVQLPTAVTKVGQTSLIQGGAVNVTFPTLAGTLVGSGDTGTVTATMLASTTGTGSTVVLSTLPTFGTTGVRFSGSTSGTTTLLASATASGILTLPAVTGTVVTTGDTGSVTSTMILNGTILDADVNASAAIAGTKISPDFGSQNVTTTGTSTAASFIPTSATVPTNGLYLSAANAVALTTNSTGRLFIDASGRVGIGMSAPSEKLVVNDGNIQLESSGTSGSTLTLKFKPGFSGTYGNQYISGINGELRIGSSTVGGTSAFTTFYSSGGTEAVRLDPAGRLLVGLTSANTSGAKLQTSDGLTFPASQISSSDPNTLDDYEEGTWTPVVTFATPGDLAVTYSIQGGTYEKIGRLVIVRFTIVTSSFTYTTASGNFRISGLPFTRANLTSNFDGAALGSFRGITVAGYSQFGTSSTGPGTAVLEVFKSGSGVNPANVVTADVLTGGTVNLIGQYSFPV